VADFTRTKALRESFIRIRLDEADLARLARTVRESTQEYGGDIAIEVSSADGAESFRSADPAFLESGDMPRELRSVSISYRRYDAPLACRFDFSPERGAQLSVDGADVHRVTGLFDDLRRQLSQRYVVGRSLVRQLDKWWIAPPLSLLAATAVYSVFDLAIDLAVLRWPSFRGSGLHTAMTTIGWTAVVVAYVAGPFPLVDVLRHGLPAGEFGGKLSDRHSIRRSVILWTFSAILMPIFVRTLFGLVADASARVHALPTPMPATSTPSPKSQ
jgi:hypothetical protein